MRHKGFLLARRARLMVALTLGLVFLSAAPLQGVHAAGFGAGGKTMLDFAGASEESYAMAIQPDGKIILAGFTISGDPQHVAVVRLDPREESRSFRWLCNATPGLSRHLPPYRRKQIRVYG